MEIDTIKLAEIANLSYENENVFKEKINNLCMNISNVDFFDANINYSIDSQLYIIVLNEIIEDHAIISQNNIQQKPNKTIIFSVRGTSSKNDIVSDIYVTKKKFGDILTKNKSQHKNDSIKVHSGFLNQYNSLKFTVMKKIIHHIQNIDEKNKLNIIFTSHSLGAAVSTLLSCLLKNFFEDKIYIINHLFGCPKIGNSNFVNYYNETIDETYRYVNQNDIIPRVPKINYKTTKNRILLGENHMNKSCCLYKKIGSIQDHSMIKYIEQLKKKENNHIIIKIQ